MKGVSHSVSHFGNFDVKENIGMQSLRLHSQTAGATPASRYNYSLRPQYKTYSIPARKYVLRHKHTHVRTYSCRVLNTSRGGGGGTVQGLGYVHACNPVQ